MSRTLVALLTSAVALFAHLPAHADGKLLPVKDADGATYGYLEQSTCRIWAAPDLYLANTQMRHDRWELIGDINTGYFGFKPVAEPWAASQRVGGFADWTLPTINEAKAFFRSFYQDDTPQLLQDRTKEVGTYWTNEITTNMAAAVRPYKPAPVLQWYTRAGASAFVWPMRHPDKEEVLPVPCNVNSAAINPFLAK